jgi:hypothetical protein
VPIDVEVTQEPGLSELIDLPDPPENELQRALGEFRASSGVAGSPLDDALDQAIRNQAEATDETFAWWDAVKRWASGHQITVSSPVQHPVALDALWLTLPDVPGAKVTVSSEDTKSRETSATLRIAGVGGGPTFNVEVKERIDFDAFHTELVTMTSPGTFEKVTVSKDGRVISEYVRLIAIDQRRVDWGRVPTMAPDPRGWGSPAHIRTFTQAASDGVTRKGLSIARGTSWQVGANVTVPQFALSVSLGAKVTYQHDIEYATELPGGHDYLAASYTQFPAYLWSVTG